MKSFVGSRIKKILMHSNIGHPFFTDFKVDPALDWQMSRAEKYAIINLLTHLKPNVSIEIGTFKGGSLQVIDAFSQEVYSIDISSAPKEFLSEKFNKVHFLVGESHVLVSQLLKDLDQQGKSVDFVLIDGDHTTAAVKRDILSVLNHPHKKKVHIILHDSFNPQCRKGISTIDYKRFPHVKLVELDYIGGSYWHNNGVEITASLQHMQKSLFWRSVHLFKDPLQFLVPFKQRLYRKLGIKQRIEMYEHFGE
jgi:hypothetical protein